MNFLKIIDILKCPETNEKLSWDEKNHILQNASKNKSYNVFSNIPILLNQIDKDSQHFNYIEHYQKDAEIFDYFEQRTGATKNDELRLAQMIFKTIPRNIKTILDVGSGKAFIAEFFQNTETNVISLDISLDNVKKAIEKYPASNHIGIVGDAYCLPFQDNTIDLIVASEVIEHLHQPEQFFREAFRCLKNSSQLIISTPYKEKIKYSLCIHCNRPTPHNAHLHSFDEISIKKLFENAGFREFKYKTFGNKALLHLRTYIITQFFPFKLWYFVDKIFNLIIPKQAHIICTGKK